MKEKKNNKNTLIQNQHHTSSGNENSASHQHSIIENNSNKRSLILSFSNCKKSNLKSYTLSRKQQQISIGSKSLNHCPNIKAQLSDEIQPSEKYDNSTRDFDDILLTKQASNIDLSFTKGRNNNFGI